MSAPRLSIIPGWLDAPPATQQPRRMTVSVKVLPPSNVEQRFEYEGLFSSSFDAYDNALERFQHVARIDVRPAKAVAE
jgi:hypothetical protein